ncbi:hypothetical protein AVEN_82356-1 [Araneus ventricosus]|uniref:Uncharacterized protein n=1 Tax=Araneus ventricosus TaxID=182803 RepID=A0A4Y2IVE0_ARAVE|nr:hypothetical protein AVEN_82356-1 [Araneus ventricosus]
METENHDVIPNTDLTTSAPLPTRKCKFDLRSRTNKRNFRHFFTFSAAEFVAELTADLSFPHVFLWFLISTARKLTFLIWVQIESGSKTISLLASRLIMEIGVILRSRSSSSTNTLGSNFLL